MNMECGQSSLKQREVETTGLEVFTVEQYITSALGFWKYVKEVQAMGADEAMIAAAKSLAWNAISRACMLDSAEESSSDDN
jgi:hypothetical protein